MEKTLEKTRTKLTRKKQLKTRSNRSKIEKHQTQETGTRYKHSYAIRTGYGDYKEIYHEDDKNETMEEVKYDVGEEKTAWTDSSQLIKSDTNKKKNRAWKQLPGSFQTYLAAILTLVVIITLGMGYTSLRILGIDDTVSI